MFNFIFLAKGSENFRAGVVGGIVDEDYFNFNLGNIDSLFY